MPTITFYVVTDALPDAHLRQACRVAEEAVDSGQRVFIRATEDSVARRIDDLLWMFGDRSFIPHEIATPDSPSHDRVRILIGNMPPPERYRDLLINLGVDIPPDADSVARIAEFVPADDERKRQARARFKSYRDSGSEPITQNA